jgi:hypothetical protein
MDIELIWVCGKQEYFCRGDSTALINASPSGKSTTSSPQERMRQAGPRQMTEPRISPKQGDHKSLPVST